MINICKLIKNTYGTLLVAVEVCVLDRI